MAGFSRNIPATAALALATGLFAVIAIHLSLSDSEPHSPLAQELINPAHSAQRLSSPGRDDAPAALSVSHHETLSSPRGTFVIANGRMNVDIDRHSLLDTVDQISRRSGVSVAADIQDRLITVQTGDVSIDAGLRQILRGFDSFYYHDGSTGDLKAVWVYEHGKGRDVAPVPSGLWMSNREIQQRLVDANPEERARAAEILIDSGGTYALNWTLQALRDSVDVVRQRTLQKAVDVGMPLPLDALREILNYDPSAQARYLALDALTTCSDVAREVIRSTIELGLEDKDISVRAHAREVLLALDHADTR